MRSDFIDITGRRFGRIVVTGFDRSVGPRKRKYFHCVCDCGKNKSVRGDYLTGGYVLSCGCLRVERATAASAAVCRTHGFTRTKTYRVWAGMLQRCTNKNHPRYPGWGGRGISVCSRWRDFRNFLEDMGVCPPDLSIDRIDNDGNYEPGNCRWADAITQRNNRRDTKRCS